MIGTRMLSMTGYGKAQKIDNGFDLTVEIRSLNNRYLDISFKIPAFLSFYEPQLRDIIKKSVIRGKVNVNIDVKKVFTTDSQVNFNFEKARDKMPISSADVRRRIWLTSHSISPSANCSAICDT